MQVTGKKTDTWLGDGKSWPLLEEWRAAGLSNEPTRTPGPVQLWLGSEARGADRYSVREVVAKERVANEGCTIKGCREGRGEDLSLT